MVDYVKDWQVDGGRIGIEDHETPGDHFFPDKYKNGERKRFVVWINGQGCGQADTMDGALGLARLAAANRAERFHKEASEIRNKALAWEDLVGRIE